MTRPVKGVAASHSSRSPTAGSRPPTVSIAARSQYNAGYLKVPFHSNRCSRSSGSCDAHETRSNDWFLMQTVMKMVVVGPAAACRCQPPAPPVSTCYSTSCSLQGNKISKSAVDLLCRRPRVPPVLCIATGIQLDETSPARSAHIKLIHCSRSSGERGDRGNLVCTGGLEQHACHWSHRQRLQRLRAAVRAKNAELTMRSAPGV